MKKRTPTFNAAHKRWLKAQARWVEIAYSSDKMSQTAYDRLLGRRSSARERATERLAAIRSRDARELSCKTEALWDMLVCDFKGEAEAIRMGDLDAEGFSLIKSIRRDAARLAKTA